MNEFRIETKEFITTILTQDDVIIKTGPSLDGWEGERIDHLVYSFDDIKVKRLW